MSRGGKVPKQAAELQPSSGRTPTEPINAGEIRLIPNVTTRVTFGSSAQKKKQKKKNNHKYSHCFELSLNKVGDDLS